MLHTVAKLHYESDLSQVEIARRLKVSTATISRLLRRARDEGIVRIEVLDMSTSEEISEQLMETLGLKRAIVIEAPSAGEAAALARQIGDLLKELKLGAESVIGIGWGRAVRELVMAGLPRIPGVDVVALTGGMQQQAPHFQINEFVRLAAEHMKGVPHFIHAPYLPSAELRNAFLSDMAINDAVAYWEKIDVAIVGIGLTHAMPPETSAATESEQALLHVAGDIVRHYFDASGAPVPWEGENRMIAVNAAQLRATPLVMGVAYSPEKAEAIIGAARAGLINGLATDIRTAQAVIDLFPNP